MHLKRQKIPKNWPIHRKGTKYIVRPNFNLKKGIPILILLRDMLKVCENRKEVRKAIHSKYILVNDKLVKNEKNSLALLDKLSILPSKKYYKLNLSKFGKFEIEEIREPDTHHKVAKIVDKKILKGKKVQLNLADGKNFLSNLSCKVNDSVVIDFKEGKIKKCLPLKEKSNVLVFAGKHSGKRGIINKIKPERKIAELEIGKEKINVLIKQFMVIE